MYSTDSCCEHITGGAVYIISMRQSSVPCVSCVYLCLCNIKSEQLQKPHQQYPTLCKLDGLLHRIYSKVLLVLTYHNLNVSLKIVSAIL